MRLVTLLAAAAALSLSPQVGGAADWPIYRGSNGTGISPERGINKDWSKKQPKLLWKTDMTDEGYAGPSVAYNKVYIIDHKDTQDIVRAIDIKTGKDVWTYSYDDTEKAFYGYSNSTPTVSGGKVYTLGRLGLVNCLDAKTGKLVWSRDICADFKGKRPAHMYTISPLVDGKNVIVCPGGPDAGVVALDKDTGKTIWQGGGDDQPGYSVPLKVSINGKQQYVVLTGSRLIGLDVNSGATLWTSDWKTFAGINAAAPIVFGNRVYVTSGYNQGCKTVEIANEGAKDVWVNKEMQAHFSSPVMMGDYIYGNGDPDHLICIDPNTGEAKWKKEGFEKGALLGIDGVLLMFEGKTGALVMLDPSPDGYKEIGRFTPLGGQSWNVPVVSNGKLIVRNTKELACFDLK